jgi:flagellar protein FliJ
MAKFKFRLEKLLEYRRLQEQWAKEAYLHALAKKVEAEGDAEAAATRLRLAVGARLATIEERIGHESFLLRLEDEYRAALSLVDLLAQEADVELAKYSRARQEREALEKLRENDLEVWRLEESRREQAALDEWAVQRRTA